MNPSDRASEIANGISDGLNCLARIQSLRTAPTIASAAELKDWHDTLGRMQKSLEAVLAGEGETTLRVSTELLRSVERVRDHLAAMAPDARRGDSLVELVDAAWAEFGKALRR